MDLGSILLILSVLVVVVGFVLQPVRERKSVSVSQEEHKLSALLAERERILDALMELDFDHDLEKIPEEVYPLQRASLLDRGAEIIRQLDEFQTGDRVVGEDSIEEGIKDSRGKATAPDIENDSLEAMIAARKKVRKDVDEAKYCHNCGEPIEPDDQFCAGCGSALN